MPGVSCYPLKWKTVYEFYEEAGVTWQVYQGEDNFDDNPLAWFEQFQKAKKHDPLAEKGLAYLGLDAFYEAVAAGTLPEVSYIVAPKELSEHPPWMPKEGAWLQKQVVDTVVNSPKYNKTMLMISYDGETPASPNKWQMLCADCDQSQKLAALVTTSLRSIRPKVRPESGWRIRMVCLVRSTPVLVSECRPSANMHYLFLTSQF